MANMSTEKSDSDLDGYNQISDPINKSSDITTPKKDSDKFKLFDLQNDEIAAQVSSSERRTKILQTVAYYCSFFGMGIIVGSLGPTLLLLAANTHQSSEAVTILFACRGLGWILGTIVWGYMYSNYPGHLLMFLSLTVTAITLCITPFLTNFFALLLAVFISSVGGCSSDVGSNIMLVSVWGKDVNPFLQFLHFCFGVGSTLSPFIIAFAMKLSAKENQLSISYITLAIVIFVSVIPLLFIPSPTIPENEIEEEEIDESLTIGQKIGKFINSLKITQGDYYKKSMTLMLAVFFFLYVGVEVAYGGWIFTFAFRFYGFEDYSASFLSSFFWLSITTGRLLGVPISLYLDNVKSLTINLAGCLISLGVLTTFTLAHNSTLIWIATGVFGLSMASIFATAFSLPQFLGMGMTSSTAAIMIASGSVGDIVMPFFTGEVMNRLGELPFLLSMFICTAIMTLIFEFVWLGFDHEYHSKLAEEKLAKIRQNRALRAVEEQK